MSFIAIIALTEKAEFFFLLIVLTGFSAPSDCSSWSLTESSCSCRPKVELELWILVCSSWSYFLLLRCFRRLARKCKSVPHIALQM